MVTAWTLCMRKKRLTLIARLGGKCQAKKCTQSDPDKLQFAHLKATKLAGAGRGMAHRLYDVEKHLTSYTVLCEDGCHLEFDNGAIAVEAHGRLWLQNV